MGLAFRTGNGLKVKIGDEELRDIRDEVNLITGDQVLGKVAGRRDAADNIRFCKWTGQSASARKFRDNLGYEPFPFEGASDSRVPLADMLIREDVDLLCNSVVMGTSGPGVMGLTGLDSDVAGCLDTLLTWEFRNGIGSLWRTELETLANYVLGDNPALGVLKVWWIQKECVGVQRVTLQQLRETIDQIPSADGTQGRGEWFARAVAEKRTEDVVGVLGEMLGEIVSDKKELLRMAFELVKDGETKFPMTFIGENHAMVRALRPYEDVFWRGSARNIQDARIVMEREWLSVGEVLERAERDEWNEEFTTKVLGEKVFKTAGTGGGTYGVTMFPTNEKRAGQVLDTAWTLVDSLHKDEVEIVTVYFRGCDGRGVEGVYFTTVNAGTELPAHDGEPVGYDHGKYPFVDVAREYLRGNCLDSRGYTEIVGTQQQQLKLQQDMRGDRTQLNTMPPVTGPMRLAGQKFGLEPGGYIEQPRQGMLNWMPMPQGGAQESKAHEAGIWEIVNQYMSRPGVTVDPSLVLSRRQAMVTKWLERIADAIRMIAQLSVQYHTDEEVMEICDVEENPFRRDAVSIRNLYHVQVFVDVSDMDKEMLLKKAEMYFKYILPLDTDQEIDRGRLRDVLMARIDPALARVARQKAADAIGSEQESEKDAFTKIAAGVEVEYLEGDHNYMARLRQLDDLLSQNQEDVGKNWSPRKKELVQKRRDNLVFGLQQQENAVTGRKGVQAGASAPG